MELVKDNVRVAWVDCGEGWNGDYNPDDPEDVALLRFDVYRRTEDDERLLLSHEKWTPIDDASYCTQMPVESTDELKIRGLHLIMDRVHEPASDGATSIKKICEELSWISPEWL